ncbi:MAG: FkbM family methyltransferase [Pseudomonadota bacterium]
MSAIARKNDRGVVLRLKTLFPKWLWRLITRPAAYVLTALPDGVKYPMGLTMRRSKNPYVQIAKDDVVFQIGCPSDLLTVGRSRSAFFLMLISGQGRLVVMEPDSINCRAMEDFAKRRGLADRLIVVNAGGWSETKELKFYQSRQHPASAMLVDMCRHPADEMARRGYEVISVDVTTVDEVLAEHGLAPPKLVSITTNGAELDILKGMSKTMADGGATYISVAETGDDFDGPLAKLGYANIAQDDRGFTYQKQS